MRTNPVKEALARGETVIGTMVTEFATPGIARLAAKAGAEFVLFDLEHTGYDYERLRWVLTAAEATDTVPFLRVPDADYQFISRGLDSGALGVMVASVETAAEARSIADAARFPPLGRRGFGLALQHDDFPPGGLGATLDHVNGTTMTLAQIETASGLDAVEAIAAVDGIDVLWIGHNDLSVSLGIPGDFACDTFQRAVDRILAAGDARGKPVGILCGSVEEGVAHLDRGFRLIAYGLDILLYQDALRLGVARLGRHRERRQPE
ncbi:MAG: aldolase/citrate lyase family protein [Thermoleophilia bacterium]|nr:aldolase/citrate lyase family protein [Thermoleophilia bacterium]MDH5333827.1 aldolase/citrate lyase family protein [Thermoleophilia bacterium]